MNNKLVLLTVLLLSACGGGGSSTSQPLLNDLADFNGSYISSFTSSISVSSTGAVCVSGGAGDFTINNGNISGTVVDSFGTTYAVFGTVAADGTISGGFSVSENDAATYTGKINSSGGSGMWEDIYRCRGTWEAERDFLSPDF